MIPISASATTCKPVNNQKNNPNNRACSRPLIFFFHLKGKLRKTRKVVPNIGSIALDREGNGIAATEAKCRDATLHISSFHFVKERGQDSPTRIADRVAQSDGAAIYIDLFQIEAKLLHYSESLHGKRLVEFKKIYILHVPSRLCQHILYAFNRRHHYQFWLDAGRR